MINFGITLAKTKKTEIIKKIIANSVMKREYIVMNIIAVSLAVLGIVQENTALIISSMILAPLILPLFGVGLGITNKNWKLCILSIRNLFAYSAIILLAGTIITFILGLFIQLDGVSYLAEKPLLSLTLITGIFSGIASAYVISHESLADSMAGVAIAVSLVPPLAASTIYLQSLNFTSLAYSLSTFILSISGIIIGSTLIFLSMNFTYSDEKEVIKQVKKEEAL